jgi:hypothetical protein
MGSPLVKSGFAIFPCGAAEASGAAMISDPEALRGMENILAPRCRRDYASSMRKSRAERLFPKKSRDREIVFQKSGFRSEFLR